MALTESLSSIGRRYDRLAAIYRLVELLFQLPPGIRRRAAAQLELRPGDQVLEIGSGSGRNFELLTRAVGLEGTVLGIEVSERHARPRGTPHRPTRLEQRHSSACRSGITEYRLNCTPSRVTAESKVAAS